MERKRITDESARLLPCLDVPVFRHFWIDRHRPACVDLLDLDEINTPDRWFPAHLPDLEHGRLFLHVLCSLVGLRIGAGPGNLLSTDLSMHKPFFAGAAAAMGMFMSVAGWICLLVGQRKLLKGLETK
jgi:hypothetical protein